MTLRHAVGLLGTALGLAFGVSSAVADDGIVITYGPPQGAPTITKATQSGTSVTVFWTMPTGHTATNIHWDTANATTPKNAGDPSEGAMMTCFASGPADGVHNCKGGRDLADTATSFTITGAAPGTYYVQVLSEGLKDQYVNGNGPFKIHYNGWSAPFTLVVKPASGGGAQPSGGGTKPADTASKPGWASLSSTTTFVRADGSRQQITGQVTLQALQALEADKKAVELAVAEGRVKIAPGTALKYLGPGKWEVVPAQGRVVGQAWFGTKKYLVVAAGTWQVETVGAATFVIKDEGAKDTVQVLAGKVKVEPRERPRSTKPLTLTAGFQTFLVDDKKAPSPPAKFTPPKSSFWK